jgi:hypothetical protein
MHRALTCDIVESSFFGIETASRYLSTTVGMSPLELSGVLFVMLYSEGTNNRVQTG